MNKLDRRYCNLQGKQTEGNLLNFDVLTSDITKILVVSRLTLWSLISCNFNLNSASNSEFCAVILHITAHSTVPKLLKNT